MLVSQTLQLRPPINGTAKMRTDNRPTNNEAEQLLGPHVERAGLVGARVESEEPVDDKVPFIENLDVETRAKLDEVLEASTMLMRDVIAALNRR